MRRRNKNVAVRMTEDEYAALMMRVAEPSDTAVVYYQCSAGGKGFRQGGGAGITKAKRSVCRHQQAAPGMATNINQMAHMANGYGQIPQQEQLRQLHQEIQMLRKECDATWRLIRQSISLQKVMEPCGTVSNM